MLFDRYSLDEVLEFDLSFSKNEIKLLHQSYAKNLNAPLSSSLGRVFDGVASLAGLCDFQTYEGEAGLLCESVYNSTCQDSFSFDIKDGVIDIDFDFFDKDLVSRFINTIVEIVLCIAKKEALEVILSGGVFQNKTLLNLIIKRFKKENISYYYQQYTPINDSGISLGQIKYFLEKYSTI
jgi:hydrogenase maturation protein HypF